MSLYDCYEDSVLVGDLTIDAFALNCEAWHVENLYEWWLPAEQRGSDKIRPGVDGSFAVRRRRAATRRQVQMFISGGCDATGTPHPNYMEGMAANLYAITTAIVDPTGTGDGTRVAVLTLPDGWTRTGDVHVLGMQVSEMRRDAKHCYAVIDVSIPGGELGIPTEPSS